ncbi:MAG: hypothetical protein ACLTLQ_06045 [[Clostridium] scindens]
MYDVLVKNGKIVTADAVFDGNIAVKMERSRLMSAGESRVASEGHRCKWNYVFPAIRYGMRI